MAGDYLQIDHELIEKPQFLAIKAKTQEPTPMVLGLLALMWRLFDRQTEEGRLPFCTPATLADSLGGSVEFWEAVAAVDWLEFDADGATMPGYDDRFGRTARRRMKDAQRKAAARRTKQPGPDPDPNQTPAGPDTTPAATPSGRSPDAGRTPCGHDADIERTEPGRSPDPGHDPKRLSVSVSESEPESEPESDPEPGADPVDHTISWDTEAREATLLLARQKFTRAKYRNGSPIFPERLQPADRAYLLKVANLCQSGAISESTIDDGLEAIRQRTQGPPSNPIAYFRSVLTTNSEGAVGAMLDSVRVPADLVHPSTPPT